MNIDKKLQINFLNISFLKRMVPRLERGKVTPRAPSLPLIFSHKNKYLVLISWLWKQKLLSFMGQNVISVQIFENLIAELVGQFLADHGVLKLQVSHHTIFWSIRLLTSLDGALITFFNLICLSSWKALLFNFSDALWAVLDRGMWLGSLRGVLWVSSFALWAESWWWWWFRSVISLSELFS